MSVWMFVRTPADPIDEPASHDPRGAADRCCDRRLHATVGVLLDAQTPRLRKVVHVVGARRRTVMNRPGILCTTPG